MSKPTPKRRHTRHRPKTGDGQHQDAIGSAPRRGSIRGGRKIIDAGPYTFTELPAVIAAGTKAAIASAWPALIADAYITHGPPPAGVLVAAMNAIATKLHAPRRRSRAKC